MSKKIKHAPDYVKNVTSDVIKHGDGDTIPQDHWQINTDITPAGNDSPASAFLPRTGKSRPTPHTKLNECDH